MSLANEHYAIYIEIFNYIFSTRIQALKAPGCSRSILLNRYDINSHLGDFTVVKYYHVSY